MVGIVFPQLTAEYAGGAFRLWNGHAMWRVFLHPFATGLLLSFAWSKVGVAFKEKGFLFKGAKFGAGVWLVAILPGVLITAASPSPR